MKKLISSVALLCVLAPLATLGAAQQGMATNADGVKPVMKSSDLFTNVIARGKNVSVTRSLFDEAMQGIKANALARREVIPPDRLNLLERQVLQSLIQVQLLTARATDADKSAGKELAEERLSQIKAHAGSDEALETQLKSVGMTRSDLVSKVTEEAIAETVMKREVKTDVSAEDIKKFYDNNPGRFEQPEMARAAHILFSTRKPQTSELLAMQQPPAELSDAEKAAKKKVAEDVLKRARAGENFGKLALEYSEDPGSKTNGGEYTFPRGQMVPEFEAAAFSLNTNQVSDIVTTAFGYHIIKLYEKIPAQTATLDDDVVFAPTGIIIKKTWKGPSEVIASAAKLSQVIRQALETDQQRKLVPDYMKKLMKDANVEILDDNLKPIEVPDAAPPAAAGTNAPAKR